jgi:hypothetical protein
MIKSITAIAALFLLSLTGYTQEVHPNQERFSASKSNGIKLSKPAIPSGINRFKKPELRIIEPRQSAGFNSNSTAQKPDSHSRSNMPVAKPDSAIHFPIIAIKPDSSFLYHLQVKKQSK